MNGYLLIFLFGAMACMGIADIVYHRNSHNLSNQLFAVFSLIGAFWIFTQDFMGRQAGDLQTAVLWIKFSSFYILCIPVFFHFLLVFTEKVKFLKSPFTYAVLYLPALFFIWIRMTTEFFGKIEKTTLGYSIRNLPADPWVFRIFTLWIVILVVLSLIFIICYYMKTGDQMKKNQIKYIFIGVSIGGILCTVEPLLSIFGVVIPALTTVELTILNLCIGYAIWKYQLFEINSAIAAGNIIATMPDFLLLIDLEGTVIQINPSLIHRLKFQESEIIGKGLHTLFKKKEFAEAIQADLLKGNPVTNHEAEMQTALGEIAPVLVSGSAVKDKKGKVVGTIYVIRDITERKQNEAILRNYTEKLKQSNHDLQEFVYIASHDLQEPLRKIIMFGDRLKEKSEGLNNQERDYLSWMQHAAERMRFLITDLLTYSRVAFNKQPPVPNDLGLILGEITTDLKAEIEHTKGTIISGDLPVIEADPIQIRQLFQHLISNALKYRQPGRPPQVKISARIFKEQRRDFAEICVDDNGIGIEPADFERVFGIFQRAQAREEYGGTGIGLAVCKKIVENHQGTIRVEGTPGEGAQFFVKLPLKQEGNS